jgi:hypothetical protein
MVNGKVSVPLQVRRVVEAIELVRCERLAAIRVRATH